MVGERQIFDLQELGAGARLDARKQDLDLSPRHHFNERVLGNVSSFDRRYLSPVAKHGDPVGDLLDLPHAMRDVDDADA